MDELTQRIKLHEGFDPSAYKDSLGYLTVGYGCLIDKRKGGRLSQAACDFILSEQINEARNELLSQSFYKYLDAVRQDALTELVFSMGLSNLLMFKNMLNALQVKDYMRAAEELKDSLWASQVGSARTNDLVYRVAYGRYS
jgi:lysozyme